MAPLFGSLCQVSKIQQRLSILLANAYDGSGMRAIKTTGAGTTYFLDDAAGQPVVEETYSASPTPTATLSVVNAWGADGLRERYTLADGSETSFFYDPQGTLVNRIDSVDSGVAVDGEPMTDVSVWDGYGQQRSDQWTNMTVDHQYTPSDQVGFEGQAGYYQDWELAKTSNPATYEYLTTTPSLLTRRYYDASTGRFVSRDPIGYGGGANLYAYCGGNPVNESDPEGTSDSSDFGLGELKSFGNFAQEFAVSAGPGGPFASLLPESFLHPFQAGNHASEAEKDGLTVGAYLAVGGSFFTPAGVEKGAAKGISAATGAFRPGAEAGGEGLGLFTSRTVSVSGKGIAIVESHLQQFGEVAENTLMIGRLKDALASGKALSGADAVFYTHEIFESVTMARLIKSGKTVEDAYEIAHGAALKKYSVSPFSVYAPEVIKALPGEFSTAWRKFWGIQ